MILGIGRKDMTTTIFAAIRRGLTAVLIFAYCASCQLTSTDDTWILINRDRYIMAFTASLYDRPHVTWWWRSLGQDIEFQELQHTPNFHESITRGVRDRTTGKTLFDIRLEVINVTTDTFGEYKVDIDGNSDLTRVFTINKMPTTPKPEVDGDKSEFSKSQVYIASGVGLGILLMFTLITTIIIVRVKTKKAGRRKGDIETSPEHLSEGVSISSHHYTDVHSPGAYEGLTDTRDDHQYITSLNTRANKGVYTDTAVRKPLKPKKNTVVNNMYGESTLIIKSGVNPKHFLKPVPKAAYKKNRDKGRRFSDSVSDHDTGVYENVARCAPGSNNYENCNNLKRTKSAH